MNAYQKAKERARERAVEFSLNCGDMNMSWADVAYYGNYFERLGRRYGLTKEFRGNGLI